MTPLVKKGWERDTYTLPNSSAPGSSCWGKSRYYTENKCRLLFQLVSNPAEFRDHGIVHQDCEEEAGLQGRLGLHEVSDWDSVPVLLPLRITLSLVSCRVKKTKKPHGELSVRLEDPEPQATAAPEDEFKILGGTGRFTSSGETCPALCVPMGTCAYATCVDVC